MWTYEKKLSHLCYTQKTGGTAGNFLFCTAGFFVIILLSFLCYLKLSQDTYPVTYFPAGFLPQEAAVVVMR